MTREFTEDEVVALARRAYRQGVADIHLAPDHVALLVIDMQDEFVRPGWTPYWIPAATRQVPRLARLLAACRARGVPVLYTAFAASHGGLDRPRSGAAMPSRYPQLGAGDPAWFRDGASGTSWHPSRASWSSTSRRMAPSTTRRWRRSLAIWAATP